MRVRRSGIVSWALIASFAAGTSIRAQQAPPSDAEVEVTTAPVELDGVELFRVRGVSSLPAEERARRIRDRLVTVGDNPSITTDSLQVVDGAGVTRIQAGDITIMTIVDADATLEGFGRVALASAHLDRIRRAVTEYRQARSAAAFRRATINALVATLLLLLSIGALIWGWRWLDGFVTRRLRSRIHSVEIQSFEVMRAEQIWSSLRGALAALRMVAFLAVVLIYVGFLLAQLPWTRTLSQGMVAFALVPLRVMGSGLVANIPSLVFLAVLFVFVRLGLRAIRLFFDAVRSRTVRIERFDPDWAEPTYKLVRLGVVAFALVVAYPYIPGSDTAAFRGVSVFIGVVFSLGSSTAIANIIAGYMMTYRRALRVGDRVKIGDAIGDVIAIRLQVTHLRSFKNEEIIISNSQILTSDVVNYSSLVRAHGLILHTEVGIGYDTPWRQVEAMLIAAADQTDGLLRDPCPFVLEKRLGDFAVVYELNVYCGDVKAMNQLYAALHRNILDVFNEYGVQIMTPAYEGDPPAPKIVAPANWHAGPAIDPTATIAGSGHK
jgi:small-conductance mechanosensitive channel